MTEARWILFAAGIFFIGLSSSTTLAQETAVPPLDTLPLVPAPGTEPVQEPLAASPLELLVQGNAYYQQGAFEEAVRAYQTGIAYGVENEVLHYNLGNALFRLGHLGPAILEYERALLLAPGDSDIQANLNFARSHAADIRPSKEEGPLAIVQNWLRQPGINGSAAAALIAYLVASILLIVTLVKNRIRPGVVRVLAVAALLLSIPPALVVVTQGSAREFDERAVVMSEREECHSGPGSSNPILFAVHEGTTVKIIDEQNGWARVSLPDGLNGWLPQESIERVRPRS